MNRKGEPSSLMPQSEGNAPAHLQDRKIKENLV